MRCFCSVSSVTGVPVGSYNTGASGVSGFCQTESPTIHIDSSAEKGFAAPHARALAMPIKKNAGSGQCSNSRGHRLMSDELEQKLFLVGQSEIFLLGVC